MNEQDNTQKTALKRPANDDYGGWIAHWKAQGQPWRTEPEIDAERQEYLTERRNIKPDYSMGVYPFKDIKLSRADIEWLLATHENGRGSIDWSDESQRECEGPDLRGADLHGVNLDNLPLARMIGSFDWPHNLLYNEKHNEKSAVHFEEATLTLTNFEQALLTDAHFEGSTFLFTNFKQATLTGAHFERAVLHHNNFEQAHLTNAHFEGAILHDAHLGGADLREAFFDGRTRLNDVVLSNSEYGTVSLADVHWGDVNVAVIDWSAISELGDECTARQQKSYDGKPKGNKQRLDDYRTAVRAYRQLAVVLRNQGINEEAARFAYRAQIMQRIVFRRLVYLPQKSLWQRVRACVSYIFSLFLDILAGYGYHPAKTVFWYLLVIGGFATAYAVFGHLPPLPDALVFSFMSFHGRGFFPSLAGETSLHNPLVVLAAAEAVIGLFIEISFIATFTQRFFGK